MPESNLNNQIFIEEGQDGPTPASPATPASPVISTTPGPKPVTGQLVNEDGVYFLKIQGSLVRVLFNSTQSGLDKFTGQVVTVLGKQDGFVITDAVIVEEQSTGATGSPGFAAEAAEIRQKFEPVLKIIDAARSRLKNIPGIIRLRPGYKFINGKITDQVALVVEVERKKAPASVKPEEMINTIIRDLPDAQNIAVEIVQASPADILFSKKLKEPASIQPGENGTKRESITVETMVGRTEFERSLIETLVPDDETERAFFMEEAARRPYQSSSASELVLVEEGMTIECHVSPEAGWKVLKQFLSDTSENLRVAIYDFTSPHIMKTLKSLLRSGVQVKMVYHKKGAQVGEPGSNKEFDLEEKEIIKELQKAGRNNFDVIAASSQHNPMFRNAYHIKVAVRDGESFWLSSGNWQGSNQPEEFLDGSSGPQQIPAYNREWHVVIRNRKLSKIFSDFIDADYKDSKAGGEERAALAFPDLLMPEEMEEIEEFAEAARMMQLFSPKKIIFSATNPLKVQPLLTPDNYIRHVIKLIRSAKKKLYLINQYIVPKDLNKIDPLFKELLDALKEKTNNRNIDCRIILRRMGKYRQNHESMKAYGFNVDNIRWFNRCHTKGIIVDGQVVMVGSHNWSEWGVLVNRDASLIMYDPVVTKYYEDIFVHDWERWARDVVMEDDVPVIADSEDVEEAALLTGYKRISWREYFH